MNPAAPAPATNADPSQFGNYSQWAQQEMAKGFSPDQLHQSLQQSGVSVAAPHSGNWLTHLLPTIGSIAAPVIGGLLAPETGGLSLIAAAGLSGLGAAGGKAAENVTEDKNPLQKDDLTAGLEGTIGGAAGGGAAKVLGTVAKDGVLGSGIAGALEKRAGGITADAAAQDTAKTASQDAIDAANATKNNFGSISDRMQGKDQLALGTNQKILDGLGYDSNDPYAMRSAAQAGNDPSGGLSLNSVYDEALQGAKPVNMSGFGNDTYKLLQNSGTDDLSTSPLGKVLSDFNGRTGSTYGNGNTVNLPDDMSATDVRKLQQSVGKELGNQKTLINNATNNGITNAGAETAHNTLGQLYDDLGAKIKTPEVDQSIAARVTTPEERAQLVSKFGDTHGNQIADTIDNSKSADDLLSPMKSYTQMGHASDMAIDDLENKTATARNVARVKGDVTDNAPAPTQQPSVLDIAHPIASGGNILGMAVKGAIHAKNNPTILNALSRIGGLASKLAPAAGSAVATSPNLVADPVGQPGTALSGTMGGTMNNTNGMTATGTVDPNSLQGILAKYMQMGTADPYLLSSTSPVVQALAPAVQKQDLLASELNTLPSSYANAGGAQGLGGLLSHLTGMIPGTAANTYEGQAAPVAQQLSATLGISPQAAMSLVPKLMQNGQSAGLTQGILGSMQGQLAPNGV
jgi:hypothetical protein